jgi:hypothetical protein
MTNHGFNQHEDEQLSQLARSLHREWDTPDLWPRIADRLRAEDGTSSVRPTASAEATAVRRSFMRRRKPATTGSRWMFPSSPVWRLAAAAAVLLTLGSVTWLAWPRVDSIPPPTAAAATDDRLLTEEAMADIERAEAEYVRAIDELTRITKPKLDTAASPLIVSLRERLMTIDTAIDEYQMEIDRNRFNAHLRQQLLWIYQEKRRTLEQVQESDRNAL